MRSTSAREITPSAANELQSRRPFQGGAKVREYKGARTLSKKARRVAHVYAGPVFAWSDGEWGWGCVGEVGRLFSDGPESLLSVCFYTNCPALRKAARMVHALRGRKIGVVRVNVPFDSPVTSNVIVRGTTARTLHGKVSLELLFRRLRSVHQSMGVPLVLVKCLGPVVRFNFSGFYQRYTRYNVSKIVVPSLPFGSCRRRFHAVTRQCSIGMVVLVAPRADRRHMHRVSRRASKFVCVISSTTAAKTRRSFSKRGHTCFGGVRGVGLHGPQVINFNVDGRTAFHTTYRGTSKTVVNDHFIALLRRRGGPRGTVAHLGTVLGLSSGSLEWVGPPGEYVRREDSREFTRVGFVDCR